MDDTLLYSRHRSTRQLLIAAAIIGAFLLASSQLLHPYVAHDDWDFMVPDAWGLAYSSPWDKTLAEGRWLNYLWSKLSIHLSPASAFPIFIAVYFSLVAAIAAQATRSRNALLVTLALFFSPAIGDLSLWPAGTIGAMAICAIATWLLVLDDGRRSALIVLGSTVLLVMAYPPLSAAVLLTAASRHPAMPARQSIAIGSAYVAGFALGTLAIYSLNLMHHGILGVRLADWRAANPPHGIADCFRDAASYLGYLRGLMAAQLIPFACAAVGSCALVLSSALRPTATRLLLATLLVCGIELGITVVSGAPMPARSAIWLWMLPCLLGAACYCAPGGYRLLGAGLLSILLVSGMHHWWQTYRHVRPVVGYESALAERIIAMQRRTSVSGVEVMGEPKNGFLDHADTSNMFQALQMSMRKQFGISMTRCGIDVCREARRLLAGTKRANDAFLVVDGKLLLVFDPQGTGQLFERNHPSVEAEHAMHLDYPLFLGYGRGAIRVTPLPPGRDELPLSLRISPLPTRYALQAENAGCKHAIAYGLVGPDGEKMATGLLRAGDKVELPAWAPDAAGAPILNVRMAEGARDNHGCNIVVMEKAS